MAAAGRNRPADNLRRIVSENTAATMMLDSTGKKGHYTSFTSRKKEVLRIVHTPRKVVLTRFVS